MVEPLQDLQLETVVLLGADLAHGDDVDLAGFSQAFRWRIVDGSERFDVARRVDDRRVGSPNVAKMLGSPTENGNNSHL